MLLESIPLLEAVVNAPPVPVTTTKSLVVPILPSFVMFPCVCSEGVNVPGLLVISLQLGTHATGL